VTYYYAIFVKTTTHMRLYKNLSIFYRAPQSGASAVYATANPFVCPSLRPSVGLFVTLQ